MGQSSRVNDTLLRIGLIADTHGLFRATIPALFAGVDAIIHAGDVGNKSVLACLRAIAPVDAVSGNVDDRDDPELPRERTLPVGELSLHVSHGDELGRPNATLLLARYPADVVVFGHTHRPLYYRADDGRMVINPGAAGPRRFDLRPSVAILSVTGRETRVEFLDA